MGACTWIFSVGQFPIFIGGMLRLTPHFAMCRLPRNPLGEWWEMEDAASGLLYYYNSMSKHTTWIRPDDATPVIPLLAVQVGHYRKVVFALHAQE